MVWFGLVWFGFAGFLEVAAWFILVLQFPAKDLFFLEGTTGLLLITYFFRNMADEKTARGKPLPKEEVEFVLIGAGEIVAIVHNSRVYPDP